MPAVNWKSPVALQLPDGKLIPARAAGLDLDGPGRGKIKVNFYTKRFLPDAQRFQFEPEKSGAPWEDIGVDQEDVDELTGKHAYGQVVNVPVELLDATLYDPGTGRMRQVPEIEVRRRIQEALSGGIVSGPASMQIVTLRVGTGEAEVLGVEPG